MAKDPAILFYTSDFLTGTMFFSHEQVGKYIRLLCAQHQQGKLTHDHMINICQSYDKMIFDKFKVDSDGLYFNERLADEIVKRKNYSESRSKNRLSKKVEKLTYVQHMENENEDINITTTTNTTIHGEVEKNTTTEKTEASNPVPQTKPIQSNLERFRQDSESQQNAYRYSKSLNRVLTIKRICQIAEAHDIAHVAKFPLSTYAKWNEYLLYFLKDHREPKQAESGQGQAYKPYNPRS